jgi:hypothetical protein
MPVDVVLNEVKDLSQAYWAHYLLCVTRASIAGSLVQAKNRSGGSRGCGLQMRATQCSQLS